jgi:putative heme-binding domain-containing protein
MPRVRRFTDSELTALAAYVRAIGRAARTPVAGSRDRGKAIYGRLGCASCHIVAGEGGSFGPELSAIGYARGAAYLRQAIVDPSAVLPRGQLVVPARGFNEFLPVRVVTNEGREVRGLRINEDAFTIQLRDMGGRLYSFRKSSLEQIVKELDKSMMPSFKDRLQPAELDDLVAYLASLGGSQ